MLDLAEYIEESKKDNKQAKWFITNGHGAKEVTKDKTGLGQSIKAISDKDLRTHKVCTYGNGLVPDRVGHSLCFLPRKTATR